MLQLHNENNEFRKEILKKLQSGKDIPQIIEELKFESEMVLMSYVCGDRVSEKNRIYRKN